MTREQLAIRVAFEGGAVGVLAVHPEAYLEVEGLPAAVAAAVVRIQARNDDFKTVINWLYQGEDS